MHTPCLILDHDRLAANCARMTYRAEALGVALRPHGKTAKCAAVIDLALAGRPKAMTVSTLAEARHFAQAGYRDITYAVGLVPAKMDEVARLRGDGVDLKVILDTPEAARGLAEAWPEGAPGLSVLIELDCGGHRGGVPAEDDQALIAVAEALTGRVSLQGVLTHGGQSYHADTIDAIRSVAEAERRAAVHAAAVLRARGTACPIVSVGSTPTALFAEHLDGVTEMRPGVYMLFDRFQAGLGCCTEAQIAVSVLASVIGRRADQGYALIDAGALALSQDLSTAAQDGQPIYGTVWDETGQTRLGDLIVSKVNQEHGFVTSPSGLRDLPGLGERVRIQPNHACMTAAPYDRYHVQGGSADGQIWSKLTGW
ncbi:MAG: alanine racemase [Rhodothalassiaceae bacterium]